MKLFSGIAAVVALPAALYGLHRLCLWLEARGQLFYLNKKPSSGAASCLVELQKFVEPPVQHVYHIGEQKRGQSEEEGQGDGPTP